MLRRHDATSPEVVLGEGELDAAMPSCTSFVQSLGELGSDALESLQ